MNSLTLDMISMSLDFPKELVSITEHSRFGTKTLSPGIYFSFVKPRKGTGHFTQLLWNSTTNVGMGHAIGSDGKVYIAARYTPPGNDAREGHLGSILESIE